MILFKVVKELNIKHRMAEGQADHAVACYAEGSNLDGLKYTVLARDSYFYVYKLSKGYVSMKYIIDKLKQPEKINDFTQVPVYYCSQLIDYIGWQSFETWFWFCILLGDYDYGIPKNIKYFRDNNLIEKRTEMNLNYMSIINYFIENEFLLCMSKYCEIKVTYNLDQKKKIFNLLRLFQFEDKNYNFINSVKIDDFERFILTTKDIKACFLLCAVEDTTECSVFDCCQKNQILREIYSSLQTTIIEYVRVPIQSSSCNVIFNKITFNPINFTQINNLAALKYLNKLNETNELDDDLTLFYTSISIWYNWLNTNKYKNTIKNVTSDLFLNTIIYNWVIIKSKSNDVIRITHKSDDLMKHLNKDHEENYSELHDLYDLIIQNRNRDSFFKDDLKIVHRLNELQAIYYCLNIYSRIKKLNFIFLSPDEFFNGSFICNFIQTSHLKDSYSYKIKSFIQSHNSIQNVFENIKKDLNLCYHSIK